MSITKAIDKLQEAEKKLKKSRTFFSFLSGGVDIGEVMELFSQVLKSALGP